MKRFKFQFGLGTIFIALTLVGIFFALYRHVTTTQDRIRYHSMRRKLIAIDIQYEEGFVGASQACRKALLEGDGERLQELGYIFPGRPYEIGYVPAQLAALDNAFADRQKSQAHRQAVLDYHTRLLAEHELAVWRPWRRVDESGGPPPEPTAGESPATTPAREEPRPASP